MAMRYIIRRTNPTDLNEVRRDVPDLDKQLGSIGADIGTAGAFYRREVEVRLTPHRSISYQFSAKKEGTTWTWICPSIELVAEDPHGLFALCDRMKAPHPKHLL